MKDKVNIAIPEGMAFSDLSLSRTADGDLEFDADVIRRICAASGIDEALFFNAPEDNLAQLLTVWYAIARANGEPPDPVMEDTAQEALIEELRGQSVSHKPGRA